KLRAYTPAAARETSEKPAVATVTSAPTVFPQGAPAETYTIDPDEDPVEAAAARAAAAQERLLSAPVPVSNVVTGSAPRMSAPTNTRPAGAGAAGSVSTTPSPTRPLSAGGATAQQSSQASSSTLTQSR